MKLVRLQIWVCYDSETGYVWPQIYDKPGLDLKLNFPRRTLRLISDPYWSDGRDHPFGKEIPVKVE